MNKIIGMIGLILLVSCVSPDDKSSTMVTIAEVPTLSLSDPLASPSYDASPTYRIENLSSMYTHLYFYSGLNCEEEGFYGETGGATWGEITLYILEPSTIQISMRAYSSYYNTWSTCVSDGQSYTLMAPPEPSELSLYSPSASPGYDATPTIRISGLAQEHTLQVFSDSSCTNMVYEEEDIYSSEYITLSALDLGTYTFYAKDINEVGYESACSSASVTYEYATAPQPSSLAMYSPSSSSGYDDTPQITVNGVGQGLTVYLYTDSSCTTQVGSATAYGTSVNVTSSQLDAGNTYNFYARTTDGTNTSDCSTETVAYTLNDPPVPTGISVTSPGNDPTPSVTVSGVGSQVSVGLYADSACTNNVGSATAYGTTATIYTATLPIGYTYTFYAKTETGGVESACSTASATYELQYLSEPTISLKYPSAASGASNSVTLEVSGLSDSDSHVDIFSDSSCSNQITYNYYVDPVMEINSGTLDEGVYTFYAKRFMSNGAISECSTSYATYEYIDGNRLTLSLYDFTDSYGNYQLAFDDINGDGLDDFIHRSSTSVEYLLATSIGIYGERNQLELSGYFAGPMGTGDFDNDGDADLVMGLSSSIDYYESLGDGTFSAGVSETFDYLSSTIPTALKTVDLDDNGNIDLIRLNQGTLYIYLSALGGVFESYDEYATLGDASDLIIEDFDGDSDNDIAFIDGSNQSFHVYLNDGYGSLGSISTTSLSDEPVAISAGDFNEDGYVDLLICSSANLSLYSGDNSGAFSSSVQTGIMSEDWESMDIGDVDGDGHLDAILVNGESYFRIYFGVGDGSFSDYLDFDQTYSTKAVMFYDFNQDGALDVITSRGSRVGFYLNQ